MVTWLAMMTAMVVGAGSSSAPENPFLRDMTEPHEGLPEGIDADWAKAPRRGMLALPKGWNAATMWGQIYNEPGVALPRNTRVQVRNLRMWQLSRRAGQWVEVQATPGASGALYRQDFADDQNVPGEVRTHADGSTSVRLIMGHNFHFWPTTGRLELDPEDVVAMASSFQARLIVDDPKHPDDRRLARWVGSCGGDFWRTRSAGWKADWSNNGDWAIGRFRRLTNDWITITATNASTEHFRTARSPVLP